MSMLRIRIQHFRSMRIRIQGFNDQVKRYYIWIKLTLVWLKIAINLSLGPRVGTVITQVFFYTSPEVKSTMNHTLFQKKIQWFSSKNVHIKKKTEEPHLKVGFVGGFLWAGFLLPTLLCPLWKTPSAFKREHPSLKTSVACPDPGSGALWPLDPDSGSQTHIF